MYNLLRKKFNYYILCQKIKYIDIICKKLRNLILDPNLKLIFAQNQKHTFDSIIYFYYERKTVDDYTTYCTK